MTVAELKEVLSNYNDDDVIYLEHPYGEDAYVYTFMLGARKEDNCITFFGD